MTYPEIDQCDECGGHFPLFEDTTHCPYCGSDQRQTVPYSQLACESGTEGGE